MSRATIGLDSGLSPAHPLATNIIPMFRNCVFIWSAKITLDTEQEMEICARSRGRSLTEERGYWDSCPLLLGQFTLKILREPLAALVNTNVSLQSSLLCKTLNIQELGTKLHIFYINNYFTTPQPSAYAFHWH